MATIAPDIRAAKLRRLHMLKLRAARSGYETPPEVETEIEDIEGDLGIRRSGVVPADHDERYKAIVRAVMQLQALSVNTRRRLDLLLITLPLLFLTDRFLERILFR